MPTLTCDRSCQNWNNNVFHRNKALAYKIISKYAVSHQKYMAVDKVQRSYICLTKRDSQRVYSNPRIKILKEAQKKKIVQSTSQNCGKWRLNIMIAEKTQIFLLSFLYETVSFPNCNVKHKLFAAT